MRAVVYPVVALLDLIAAVLDRITDGLDWVATKLLPTPESDMPQTFKSRGHVYELVRRG